MSDIERIYMSLNIGEKKRSVIDMVLEHIEKTQITSL